MTPRLPLLEYDSEHAGGIDSKVLSEDEMWRKLDTIVETAAQVWR
jgi:hypothetical protein